jgi:diguanylate cyclase (GGDEF)-like protein
MGITVSIGVASFPKEAESEERLIGAADQALYAAKQAGRNRVGRAENP